ncbi:hypothetical protein COLO4_18074 [Corchorus olitorius]|uniref:Uncharacterized protein n=1 Tax=Corchorus olitorius TaxID=93759 RepID=A0A1R3JAK1_9ROSI|nr:hypothetical protein COLO4_18074 [Corchorus olitorius]
MKIFSWVQNKLTNKKSNPIQSNHHIQQPCKEEFSDWPHGLLAIGTFGNKIKQQEPDDDLKPNLIQEANNFPSGQDHHITGLTPEEVGRLQKELNLIFDEHVGVDQHTSSTNDHLEAEERNCSSCSDEAGSNNNHFQYNSSLVQSRAKDVCSDNSKGSAIGKKSLSFLLKKMFMLRTLLHKKIYPQSSSGPKLSTKKPLESGRHIIPKTDEKPDDGSKWVKTDSEYWQSYLKGYKALILEEDN